MQGYKDLISLKSYSLIYTYIYIHSKGRSKFQKLASNKIRCHKIHDIFYKIRKLFLLLFYNVCKVKMFTIELNMGAKRPNSLEHVNSTYTHHVLCFLQMKFLTNGPNQL